MLDERENNVGCADADQIRQHVVRPVDAAERGGAAPVANDQWHDDEHEHADRAGEMLGRTMSIFMFLLVGSLATFALTPMRVINDSKSATIPASTSDA